MAAASAAASAAAGTGSGPSDLALLTENGRWLGKAEDPNSVLGCFVHPGDDVTLAGTPDPKTGFFAAASKSGLGLLLAVPPGRLEVTQEYRTKGTSSVNEANSLAKAYGSPEKALELGAPLALHAWKLEAPGECKAVAQWREPDSGSLRVAIAESGRNRVTVWDLGDVDADDADWRMEAATARETDRLAGLPSAPVEAVQPDLVATLGGGSDRRDQLTGVCSVHYTASPGAVSEPLILVSFGYEPELRGFSAATFKEVFRVELAGPKSGSKFSTNYTALLDGPDSAFLPPGSGAPGRPQGKDLPAASDEHVPGGTPCTACRAVGSHLPSCATPDAACPAYNAEGVEERTAQLLTLAVREVYFGGSEMADAWHLIALHYAQGKATIAYLDSRGVTGHQPFHATFDRNGDLICACNNTYKKKGAIISLSHSGRGFRSCANWDRNTPVRFKDEQVSGTQIGFDHQRSHLLIGGTPGQMIVMMGPEARDSSLNIAKPEPPEAPKEPTPPPTPYDEPEEDDDEDDLSRIGLARPTRRPDPRLDPRYLHTVG